MFMKKIGVSYANYYNQKYQRIGHVFHDRYSGTVRQSYRKKNRNDVIRKLLQEGLSIRQTERLTGIGRGVIQNIRKNIEI